MRCRVRRRNEGSGSWCKPLYGDAIYPVEYMILWMGRDPIQTYTIPIEILYRITVQDLLRLSCACSCKCLSMSNSI